MLTVKIYVVNERLPAPLLQQSKDDHVKITDVVYTSLYQTTIDTP